MSARSEIKVEETIACSCLLAVVEERREVCEREKREGKVKRREPKGGNERIENL